MRETPEYVVHLILEATSTKSCVILIYREQSYKCVVHPFVKITWQVVVIFIKYIMIQLKILSQTICMVFMAIMWIMCLCRFITLDHQLIFHDPHTKIYILHFWLIFHDIHTKIVKNKKTYENPHKHI